VWKEREQMPCQSDPSHERHDEPIGASSKEPTAGVGQRRSGQVRSGAVSATAV
jgi:hypothetical protein